MSFYWPPGLWTSMDPRLWRRYRNNVWELSDLNMEGKPKVATSKAPKPIFGYISYHPEKSTPWPGWQDAVAKSMADEAHLKWFRASLQRRGRTAMSSSLTTWVSRWRRRCHGATMGLFSRSRSSCPWMMEKMVDSFIAWRWGASCWLRKLPLFVAPLSVAWDRYRLVTVLMIVLLGKCYDHCKIFCHDLVCNSSTIHTSHIVTVLKDG